MTTFTPNTQAAVLSKHKQTSPGTRATEMLITLSWGHLLKFSFLNPNYSLPGFSVLFKGMGLAELRNEASEVPGKQTLEKSPGRMPAPSALQGPENLILTQTGSVIRP